MTAYEAGQIQIVLKMRDELLPQMRSTVAAAKASAGDLKQSFDSTKAAAAGTTPAVEGLQKGIAQLGGSAGSVRGQLGDLFAQIGSAKATIAQTRSAIDDLKSGTVGLGTGAGGAAPGVGTLSARVSSFGSSLLAVAPHVGIFITSMLAINAAAKSDTFQRWASTGDDLAARFVRWTYGLRELTDAQYASARAAMASADAFKEQGGAIGYVARVMQEFKDQGRDAKLEIQALDQLLKNARASTSSLNLMNSPGALFEDIGKARRIADAARSLQGQGYALTPGLEDLVTQFDAVKERAKDAEKAARESAREAEQERRANVRALKDDAADVARRFERIGEFWERQQAAVDELVRSFDGTKLAREAEIWIDALKEAGGVKVLDAKQLAAGNALIGDAITAAKRAGQQIPPEWIRVWFATEDVVGSLRDMKPAAADAHAALKDLAGQPELPTLAENMRNLLELSKQLSPELRKSSGVKPPRKEWSDWSIEISDSFAVVADAFRDETGRIVSSLGAIANGALRAGDAAAYMVQSIRAGSVAQGIGGAIATGANFWRGMPAGQGAGSSMAMGAMQGAMTTAALTASLAATGLKLGMWGGPAGMAIGAGAGALVGFVKSRIVGGDEKAARKAYDEWKDQVLGTLTLAQAGEAAGREWAGVLIGVRDAFQDIGLTEADAMAALEQLNAATHVSAEAVKDAFEGINVALERQAQLRDALAQRKDLQADILKQAVEKYGISFDAAGPGYQMGSLATRSEEAIQYRDALLGSGMDESAVLTAMAEDMSALAADAKRASIDLPTELRDSMRQLSDMGLLRDEHGNRMNADALSFSDELKPMFESMLSKLDELITELKKPIEALRGSGPMTAMESYLQFGPNAQTMHTGGMVSAPIAARIAHSGWYVRGGMRSDEVPVVAQTGEGILSRDATSRIGGASAIDHLNAGGSLGDSGGPVFHIGVVHVHDVQDPDAFADRMCNVIINNCGNNGMGVRSIIRRTALGDG